MNKNNLVRSSKGVRLRKSALTTLSAKPKNKKTYQWRMTWEYPKLNCVDDEDSDGAALALDRSEHVGVQASAVAAVVKRVARNARRRRRRHVACNRLSGPFLPPASPCIRVVPGREVVDLGIVRRYEMVGLGTLGRPQVLPSPRIWPEAVSLGCSWCFPRARGMFYLLQKALDPLKQHEDVGIDE